ncbi:MAG: glycosyltransferase family 2 protein [Verrucomicrobiota bacterium]
MQLSLHSLPSPPPGRTGWPWTEGAPPIPEKGPNGQAWPRISIAIPSFRQGHYIEETLRSVLLQGYPNLDLVVIDGGSKDDTVSILKKYEPWLSSWVSEKDRGQCEAINKGFARCNGEIFNWLCSDDLLRPGALHTVGQAFCEKPPVDIIVGSCYIDFEGSPEKNEVRPSLGDRFARHPYVFAIWQPSCFFRRSLITRPELVLERMNYCMDRELWCYLWSRQAKWKWTSEVLSVNRFTGNNKCVKGKGDILKELDLIYRAYIPERIPLTFWLRRVWLPLVQAHRDHRVALVRMGSRLISRTLSLSLHAAYSKDRVRVLQDEFYMYGMW